MEVLDHGSVTLMSSMGDDLSVVNSARVSYGKRHLTFDQESDAGLIRYLMKHRHGTPFEHNAFTFYVIAPIFVFREWQRHRIGSFNEMSARYMELPGKWYIPSINNVRCRVGKPGSYTYERMEPGAAEAFCGALHAACANSYTQYQRSIEIGVAPEQARMFLHVNHYSEMYWTVNARSLMNFISLRNADTAQWEIQQYAKVIEDFFHVVMPHTYEAFVTNNRIAP